MGNFHQSVLGHIKGFVDHNAGYDVECADKKVLAEIKNKHNTLNSQAKEKATEKLKAAVSFKPGFTGYLVIMIPKKPERYKTKLASKVYEVDGTSFYALAADSNTALRDLYQTLADRICIGTPQIKKHCLDIFNRGMAP